MGRALAPLVRAGEYAVRDGDRSSSATTATRRSTRAAGACCAGARSPGGRCGACSRCRGGARWGRGASDVDASNFDRLREAAMARRCSRVLYCIRPYEIPKYCSRVTSEVAACARRPTQRRLELIRLTHAALEILQQADVNLHICAEHARGRHQGANQRSSRAIAPPAVGGAPQLADRAARVTGSCACGLAGRAPPAAPGSGGAVGRKSDCVMRVEEMKRLREERRKRAEEAKASGGGGEGRRVARRHRVGRLPAQDPRVPRGARPRRRAGAVGGRRRVGRGGAHPRLRAQAADAQDRGAAPRL